MNRGVGGGKGGRGEKKNLLKEDDSHILPPVVGDFALFYNHIRNKLIIKALGIDRKDVFDKKYDRYRALCPTPLPCTSGLPFPKGYIA